MTTKDVLRIWDRYLECDYPEGWALRMWCRKYNYPATGCFAGVARRAMKQGRLALDGIAISKYLSGVLRRSVAEDAKVEQEICDHVQSQIDSKISEQMK